MNNNKILGNLTSIQVIRIHIAILISITILLISFDLSFALTFNTTRVTNNNLTDYPGSLSNGTIAWIRGNNTGLQIFIWDGNSTVQLTDDHLFRKDISLHNGHIACVADEVLPGNILANYVHFFDGHSFSVIDSTFHNNMTGIWFPSMHAGKIAWIKDDHTTGKNLYFWDGSVTHKITNNNSSNFGIGAPSTYDGTVAWSVYNSGTSLHEIFYWNGTTTTAITTNGESPSLYDGKIAFVRNRDIYFWDGSTITQITNDGYHNKNPSLYDGTIAWVKPANGYWRIVYWDGSSIIPVSYDLDFDTGSPSLFDGEIAFTGSPSGSNEIFFAELKLSPPTPNPSNNSTDVMVDSDISASFVDDIDPTTIDTSSFYIAGVAGSVSYDVATKTATLTPDSELTHDTTYTVTITTNVENLNGISLQSDFIWSFTTGSPPDVTAPAVNSTDPSNSAISIPINTTVSAIFSEDIDPSTIDVTTFTVNNGVSGVVSYDVGTKTATITPSANLAYNTTYTATLTIGITDLALNPLQTPYSWSFTTGAAPDTTPPTVDSTSPADNETDVPLDSFISVIFSEDMDPATIDSNSLHLDNGVTGTVSYDAGTRTATLTPAANLDEETTYTLTVTTGVQDVAGNALQVDAIFSFTTISESEEDGGSGSSSFCFINTLLN